MGLFTGRKRGAAAEAGMDIPQALVAPALLAIGADHAPDRARLARLAVQCGLSPVFAGRDQGAILKLLDAVAADFGRRGPNAVMNEAVAALPRPLRETAMAFAMRAAMDEGEVGEAEQHLLMAMSRQMDLPDELTDTIFSVIAILQRAPGD